MIYIKKVVLENFQSHKYTEIEFDKYLNVIVGPSDHGKTAIIRGIKWALFNEPTGDYFIREGETECSVTVVFSNNIKIKRYRSKSKNYYYIYDSEGKETILEGFGTKVPEEVINKTSIKKILLDSNVSNSINIGEQLEGPFLLSEMTSTRANAIGRLVGVHIVDDALRDALKDIRNLKSEKKAYEDTLEKLNGNLKEYDYLEDIQLKAEKLERIKSKIKDKQKRLNTLTQKLQLIKDINNEMLLYRNYLSKLEKLDRISQIEKSLNIKVMNFSSIYNRYERLKVIRSRIEKDETLLKSLIHIERVEKSYNIVSSKEKKLLKLNELYSDYNYIRENISKNKKILYKLKDINTVEKNLSLVEEKYNELKSIMTLKNRLDKINKSLSIGKVYIERLSAVEGINGIKNSIESKCRLLENFIIIKARYDDNKASYTDTYKKLIKVEKDIGKLLEQYEIALGNLEICPLCYSSIDKAKIKNIINSYKL